MCILQDYDHGGPEIGEGVELLVSVWEVMSDDFEHAFGRRGSGYRSRACCLVGIIRSQIRVLVI